MWGSSSPKAMAFPFSQDVHGVGPGRGVDHDASSRDETTTKFSAEIVKEVISGRELWSASYEKNDNVERIDSSISIV